MSAGRPPTLTVYWYSQTGQLKEAADAFTAPLAEAGWRIQWREVRPRTAFPFPWPMGKFVSLLPDAVDPSTVVDVTVGGSEEEPPDLVLFAFQVWYLAPSLPMRSALAKFSAQFRDRPVLGLTACRNMWYSAALAAQRQISSVGGNYVGTVAAIDSAPAGATFVTTMRWMLTGKREAFWFFPRAGVGPDQLARLQLVGAAVAKHVRVGGPEVAESVADALRDTDPAPVEPAIAAADLLAGRVFRVWSKAARVGRPGVQRGVILTAFAGWLTGAVIVGLPAVVLARVLGRSRFDAVVRKALRPAVVTS